MRICRFTLMTDADATPRLGVMEEAGIRDVTAVTDELPQLRWPLPRGDQMIANLTHLRPRMEAVAAQAPLISRERVRLPSPVANPGKFICGVGNWKHHKAPLGMLGFLFKVTSALAGEGEGVQLRWPDRTTVHEPELAEANDGHAVWNADGKQILWNSGAYGFRDEAPLYDNTFQPYGQNWIMNADGSDQRMITDSPWEDSMPLYIPASG